MKTNWLIIPLILLPQLLVAEPLKLAVVAPLSGGFATYGEPIARGAKLAAKDLRESGQDTKIILEDACLPADAVRSAKRLVDIEKVDAVVGSYCVIGLEAMLPVLTRNKVPIFHTSVVPESMLKNDKDYLFSTNTSIEYEGKYLAETAYNQLSARNVGIVFFRSQWGESYSDAFAKKFKELGGKIAGIETTFINDDKSTLAASLLRLSQSKPDLLFIVSIGSESGILMKQARNLGMKLGFLSVNEIEDKNMLTAAGKAAEGMEYSAHAPGDNKAYAAFSKKYITEYGEAPHPLARHAYDASMLAAKAFNSCATDKDCLKTNIEAQGSTEGASGRFSIEKNGASNRELFLKQVKSGKFSALDSAS